MTTPGRNDPCHCGSGKKYKKCCLPNDDAEAHAAHVAAEAERQKAAAEQESAEGDSAEAGAMPAPKSRSPHEGVSKFWGHDDRVGRSSGGAMGRSRGSGHR